MLNRLVSRRAVVTSAAAATAAVPAVALAAHQAEPDPEPPKGDAASPVIDGLAVMHLEGRRLLVSLHRMPEPGDEVVALVSEPAEGTRVFAVFKAADYHDPHHTQHGARRVYWDCIGRVRVGEAIGVVVGVMG